MLLITSIVKRLALPRRNAVAPRADLAHGIALYSALECSLAFNQCRPSEVEEYNKRRIAKEHEESRRAIKSGRLGTASGIAVVAERLSCPLSAASRHSRVRRASCSGPRVLSRIADTLMLDPTERAMLFELAVLELATTKLRPQTNAVQEAFGSLRSLTRRLWAATTAAEALGLVRANVQPGSGILAQIGTVCGTAISIRKVIPHC